jgi:hypothetical protein
MPTNHPSQEKIMHDHHAHDAIAVLDLTSIRTRLMHPHAGLGWSEARTIAVESDYREFLLFAKLYPAATPSPGLDVDQFWHFHILDTMKYARDCDDAFGYFLHHQPDTEFEDEFESESTSAGMPYCALTGARSRMLARRPAAYCALTGAKEVAAAQRPAAYCALAGKTTGVATAARQRKKAYCAGASAATQ